MDEEIFRRVKEIVTEVCKGRGYGEVRIIIERNRPRYVRLVVDECLEDRHVGTGRPGTAQVT
jgi:hypothetical protein